MDGKGTAKFMLNTKTFTIGNMKAGPGESCSGLLELAEGKFKLPAAVLNGEKPGKTVLLSLIHI